MPGPFVGETWRHFKGNLYVVTGFCLNVEGNEPVRTILYMADKDMHLSNVIPCSRSVENFLEVVDRRVDYDYKGPRFVRFKEHQ